jgi:hypothetical protein
MDTTQDMQAQDMQAVPESGIAQALPSVLVPTQYDDQMQVTVETQVLDANSFFFAQNQPSVARFELPKKAVLASNSELVFTALWTNPAAINPLDRQATLPKMGGALVLIKSARISTGGKLLQAVENCGQYIYVKDYSYKSWEHRVGIDDLKYGAESDYSIDASGNVLFNPEHTYRYGSNGVECAIALDNLFPIFNDVELPLALLNHNVLIEVQFESVWTNVWTETGAAFDPDDRFFTIVRPRLLVDYVNYPAQVMQKLAETLKAGINMPFRDMVLVKKTQIAGANTHDIGMSNELVGKIFIQKLATGNTPTADVKAQRLAIQKTLRSDLDTQEVYNFIINNKLLYDRDVTKLAEKYSYLSQCNAGSFRTLPGMYEQQPADLFATTNFIARGTPAQVGPPAVPIGPDAPIIGGYPVTEIYRIQGRQQFLGVNMGAYRAIDDSPLNAVAIQDTPIVLKLTTQHSCQLNCYIEKVRNGTMAGGEIMVTA